MFKRKLFWDEDAFMFWLALVVFGPLLLISVPLQIFAHFPYCLGGTIVLALLCLVGLLGIMRHDWNMRHRKPMRSGNIARPSDTDGLAGSPKEIRVTVVDPYGSDQW
jgi:hypothetical protein